jgi:outer membrane receptor protein involved in Fe transport
MKKAVLLLFSNRSLFIIKTSNEVDSIVADGYTVFDFNVGYNWRNMVFGIQVQNLFDVEWNETQFATESRLFDEPNPVEEINFTPGTPFFLRASIQYNF